jgi:MerR family transcriptional regulator, thiopeptide resistance regulator
MSVYTVSELARLSGVSVRALHHYDEIGLLKPVRVGENGYRYYGREELLRLQQILFHRELGFPLAEICVLLEASDFDHRAALRAHRQRLMAEARRYRRLVKTLDATLAALEGDAEMDEKAMYRGFSPEKQAEHEAWLIERYGEPMRGRIADSKAQLKGFDPAAFEGWLAELEEIEAALAAALAHGAPADSEAVRRLMSRHHAWVGRAWGRGPDRTAYAGLADLYEEHPEFRARYEARATGFTEYLAAAMRAYAAQVLS